MPRLHPAVEKRIAKIVRHREPPKNHVYIFYNRKTRQAVHSLRPDLLGERRKAELRARLNIINPRQLPSRKDQNELWRREENQVLAQLPFFGKKTVPGRIRSDLWIPLAKVVLPSEAKAKELYRKLREYQILRAYTWKIHDPNAPSVNRVERKRYLMDQKAHVVAHLADALERDHKLHTSLQENIAKYLQEQERWQIRMGREMNQEWNKHTKPELLTLIQTHLSTRRDIITQFHARANRKDYKLKAQLKKEFKLNRAATRRLIAIHQGAKTRFKTQYLTANVPKPLVKEQGSLFLSPSFLKHRENGVHIWRTLLTHLKRKEGPELDAYRENEVQVHWPATEEQSAQYAASWSANVVHRHGKKSTLDEADESEKKQRRQRAHDLARSKKEKQAAIEREKVELKLEEQRERERQREEYLAAGARHRAWYNREKKAASERGELRQWLEEQKEKERKEKAEAVLKKEMEEAMEAEPRFNWRHRERGYVRPPGSSQKAQPLAL